VIVTIFFVLMNVYVNFCFVKTALVQNTIS